MLEVSKTKLILLLWKYLCILFVYFIGKVQKADNVDSINTQVIGLRNNIIIRTNTLYNVQVHYPFKLYIIYY